VATLRTAILVTYLLACYILFEKYITFNILALEMASHAGNRHRANCVGALSSPTAGPPAARW